MPKAVQRYRLGRGEESVLAWALAHPSALVIEKGRYPRPFGLCASLLAESLEPTFSYLVETFVGTDGNHETLA